MLMVWRRRANQDLWDAYERQPKGATMPSRWIKHFAFKLTSIPSSKRSLFHTYFLTFLPTPSVSNQLKPLFEMPGVGGKGQKNNEEAIARSRDLRSTWTQSAVTNCCFTWSACSVFSLRKVVLRHVHTQKLQKLHWGSQSVGWVEPFALSQLLLRSILIYLRIKGSNSGINLVFLCWNWGLAQLFAWNWGLAQLWY